MERGSASVAYIYDLNNASIPAVMGPAGVSGNGVPAVHVPASVPGAGPPPLGLPPPSVANSMVGLLPPHPVPVGQLPQVATVGAANLPADENYCLRWNDYEKKYAETFRGLRDDEFFTDVTLATDGYSVKAHRVILSACSNYFHAILKNMSPWQHPVLLLQEVKSSDLNSLMDFIYSGQVSVNQDSLQSFLNVAEKLKIKGLCETLAPPPPPPLPPHHAPPPPAPVVTSAVPMSHIPPPPVAMPPPARQVSAAVSGNNFEGLLPRSPYIPEPSVVPLASAQSQGGPASSVAPTAIAVAQSRAGLPPAAHQQSPRQGRSAGPRPASESLVHYASPKRTKYAASPSILRNQLQPKDGGDHHGQQSVEVKSEPMAILSTQEEVPSSGVNVTEFITTHENDLAALPSLGHGISPQFMFSPEPGDGNPQGNGHGAATQVTVAAANVPSPAPGAMVTIDEKTVRMHAQHQPPPQQLVQAGQHQQQQQQHHVQEIMVSHAHLHPPPPPHSHASNVVHQHHDEPQDLTPGPQESPNGPHLATGNGPQPAGAAGNLSIHSTPSSTPTPMASANNSLVVEDSPSPAAAPTPTPPKKDRNSRKTCPYCHKDFHEMSLKRHIKDVHFRNQNTYVICPQCCKQYASQNSLYSHLNRVHGVKKDMMGDIQLQMVSPATSGANTPSASAGASSSAANSNPASANTSPAGPANLQPQHASTPGTPGNSIGGQGQAGGSAPGERHDGIMDLAQHSENSN